MGRIGILLLNLGGPDTLEDVRPFLFNLFSDPEIIRLPFPWMQHPLAWLISSSRARRSEENYTLIGGGSPLRRITEEQAAALETQLRDRGHEATTYVGMRYWHPYTEEATAKIVRDRLDRLVILPLYPQFSISTSGSSFRLLDRLWREDPQLQKLPYTVVPSWYDEPSYLQSMANLIATELDKFPEPERVQLFFSAHGVPKSYVEEAGDPYQQEIEACVSAILKVLDRPNPHVLAYQSRVGPVEWLQPYSEDALEELGAAGAKEVLVIPISFVSEHIETLQEIDVEYREVAEAAGIEDFRRVPAPNTDPTFIQSLCASVEAALEAPPQDFAQVTTMRKRVKMYPQSRVWGMTTTAEVWNGRIAMLGFIALLAELVSGRGLLHMVGLL